MARSMISRGSVVLVRYPFTDLTGAKVRPALVVTPDNLLLHMDDVLCSFISSNMPEHMLTTDFILDNMHPSFRGTGLKHHSVFRMHKLALLHRDLIASVLGAGDRMLMVELDQRLRLAVGL